MKNAKKRMSLLVTLLCAFVLVLSLGIVSACGGNESANAGSWYYGEEIPTSDLGQEGDYYLNTETLKSYVKEGKAWREASMEETGAKWYYGTEGLKGDENFGATGDFYLNTKSGDLYQKNKDGWGDVILTLKGEDGRDGVVWHSGEGSPVGKEIAGAKDGDFYLDTENDKFDVYQLFAGTWQPLGAIKGADAVDPVRFFDGNGAPSEDNPAIDNPKAGDLYIGQFDGSDGHGAGSRLYKYDGKDWQLLMESVDEKRLDIYNLDQLIAFGKSVEKDSYEGKEVHLKANIDFNDAGEGSRTRRVNGATDDWTPIGSLASPFKGTFDGEGHIISNFSVTATDNAQAAGFFGYIENATVHDLHFVGANVTVTGKDAVAAVVVGQAKGDISFNNVTVEATCEKTEDSATVGGLVGSLAGTNEETSLTVSGSSFDGTGASDLVGDKGEVENVTVTDSAFDDGTGNKTEWDEEGKTKMTYAVADEASLIEKLNEVIESGGEMGIALSDDVNLNELPTGPLEDDGVLGPAESHPKKEAYVLGTSADKKVDLTIDLNGHNLDLVSYLYRAEGSYVSYIRINAITVKNGSTLTITNSAKAGKLSLITCGKSPIEVNGTGSSVTFKNIEVDCKCTYSYINSARLNATMTGFNPAITATNGGTVNLLEGAHFTAFDDGSTLDPNHPDRETKDGDYSMDTPNRKVTLYRVGYIVTVSAGTKTVNSVLNIDGATVDVGGMVTPFVVSDKYAELNFKSGTITSSSGGGCAAFLLSDLGVSSKATGQKDCGVIRMTGGTINMTGSADAPEDEKVSGYKMYMIAITDNQTDAGKVYVSGGTINLMPTSGIAVGIAAYPGGSYGKKLYQVGGDVTINVQAKENGYAAALACASVPQFYLYQGLNIKFENGSDTSPDTNKNVDFFWQGTLPWIGKVSNHVFKGSTPQVDAEMGMIDERSTPMPKG